jgi:hypothetical protein
MARNIGVVTPTAEIAAPTGGLECVMYVKAPSNQRVAIKRISVSFDSTSNSAAPVQVKVAKLTSDGTGGSSKTPAQKQPNATTLQATAKDKSTVFSAEPSVGDVLDFMEIHPQGGVYIPYTFLDEIVINGGERLGILIFAGAAVNCIPVIEFEE